jgi:hypothetical protein
MKLIRFATIYLKLEPADLTQLTLEVGGIPVDVQNVSHQNVTRLLLRAAVSLDCKPEVSSDGEVTVPDQPRKQAESAIEAAATVLSVLNHSARRISSPFPYVALYLENEQEARWASNLSRFAGHNFGIPQTTFNLPPTPEYLAALADRLDGATLLTEAISQDHATGKFHEFMRLFERAFALVPSQFEKKLAQFLEGADLGYQRAEVKSWIDLRNPATHANDSTRSLIVLESDIRPVIARMEQAAYDVLWNKKTWQDPSRERRLMWQPTVATVSSSYDVMLTQGLGAKYLIQMLDPYKAFSHDASFRPPAFPPHLWACWPKEMLAFKGALRVRAQSTSTPLEAPAS